MDSMVARFCNLDQQILCQLELRELNVSIPRAGLVLYRLLEGVWYEYNICSISIYLDVFAGFM